MSLSPNWCLSWSHRRNVLMFPRRCAPHRDRTLELSQSHCSRNGATHQVIANEEFYRRMLKAFQTLEMHEKKNCLPLNVYFLCQDNGFVVQLNKCIQIFLIHSFHSSSFLILSSNFLSSVACTLSSSSNICSTATTSGM